MNDHLTESQLAAIEARLDAFGEWYARVVIEGGSYDHKAALEDFRLLDEDMRRLLEQARARAI